MHQRFSKTLAPVALLGGATSGIVIAFVVDPEGNILELIQPPRR